MNPCANRFHSIRFNAALLLLIALALPISDAKGAALQPFDASYAVYRNDQHVADSRFELQRQNDTWIWRLQTHPVGIYRWLTRKKPFTETRMVLSPGGPRLSQLASGDYADKPPRASSWFDFDSATIFHTDSKHNRQQQLQLPDPLYSFHDVHLLYAEMKQAAQSQRQIHFYDKGRLYQSTLTLETNVALDDASDQNGIDRMIQQLDGTGKKMLYYYQAHDLAPLQIERYKDGKLKTVMRRSALTD